MSTVSVDVWGDQIGRIEVDPPQWSKQGHTVFNVVRIKDKSSNHVFHLWVRGEEGVEKARELSAALLASADIVEGMMRDG